MSKVTVSSLTSNGSTDLSPIKGTTRNGKLPLQRVSVQGTFDGATATIQFSDDSGTTYQDLVAFTAAGSNNLELFSGSPTSAPVLTQVTITDAGGSTDLTVILSELP